MPLKNCNVDGKAGYQWGDQGKCYTGPGAKKKALKQGVAVEGPEKFSEYMKNRGEVLSEAEIKEIIDFMYDEGYGIAAITATTITLQKIRAPKDGKMGADGYYVHMKKNNDKKKKDSKKDSKGTSGKTKIEWDKVDRKELKRDTKKEKKEHEKDAVKDDDEKIKRLKKDPSSEKKKSEIRDLEKDKKYDKKGAKSASDRQRHERLDRDEKRQDKSELDSDTLRQRIEHHKDAIKNLEREIKDLEKDKREDKKDIKEESRGLRAHTIIADEFNSIPVDIYETVVAGFTAVSKGAKLTTKQVNDLPDSDFAYIAPGGKKVDGKTEPRSLRHLPIPDAAHVRNALARLSQTHIPEAAKQSALRKIKSRAKKFGIDVS